MENETKQSVANSLETDVNLLPYMPYLLQDLWALGSSVDQIIHAISQLSINNENPTVLDLGCGKGVISIKAAAEFGYTVHGIDAEPNFLNDAQKKAENYNVSHLCNFEKQDIINYTKQNHDFDIAILASLGGVFGTNIQTVKVLRNQIKSGGYIIIDDGYLRNTNSIERKGYEHYRNYKNTIEEITSFGDKLINEFSTSDISKEINDEYIVLIEKRIHELSNKHPDLRKRFYGYLEQQKEECEVLENDIEGMLWVLQKI